MNYRGSRGGCVECESLHAIFDDFYKLLGGKKKIKIRKKYLSYGQLFNETLKTQYLTTSTPLN